MVRVFPVLILLILTALHCSGPPEQKYPVDCAVDEGPCVKEGPDGTVVALDISPRPVRTMSTLTFRVDVRDGKGEPVTGDVMVELLMPGMYMGKNIFRLEQAGEGTFEGVGTIVTCPTGGKTWRAIVRGPSGEPVPFTFRVDQ